MFIFLLISSLSISSIPVSNLPSPNLINAQSSENASSYPRTEVWQGEQEIFKKGLEELFSVKLRYDSIVDDNGPSIIVNNKYCLYKHILTL